MEQELAYSFHLGSDTIRQSVGCESTLLFTPFTVTKVLNSYEEILNMEINWGELTYGK